MARRKHPLPIRWDIRPRFYTPPAPPDLTVPPRIRQRPAATYGKVKKSKIRRGRFYEAPNPPDLTVPPRIGTRPPAVYSRIAKARDRKSTRLNSSHTVISYAVFCLKK